MKTIIRGNNAERALWLLLILSGGQFIYFTLLTLNQPIIDMFGFRPAQTAISAWYMVHGQGWIANIMPVFGHPWVFVQEFPIYQWIVAAIVLVTRIPLDSAGRLVSAAFVFGCIYPIWLAAKVVYPKAATRLTLIVATLWLASPVIVFWGRAFMIETCVVFLSLMWLAFYLRTLIEGNISDFTICCAFGVLAAMEKPTAFAVYVLAGFVYTIWIFISNRPKNIEQRSALLLTAVIIPAISMAGWNHYSDWTLSQNSISNVLRVSNMPSWYFGTLKDRTAISLWQWTILDRDLPRSVGFWWYVPLLGSVILIPKPLRILALIALIAVYLGAYIMFPSLHRGNEYYLIENVLFILLVEALIIEGMFSSGFTFVAVLLLVCGMGIQTYSLYEGTFGPLLFENIKQNPIYLAGKFIRDNSKPNSVIAVFGDLWAADAAYYSERKSIVVMNWIPKSMMQPVLDSEASNIGGIIDCHLFTGHEVSGDAIGLRDALITSIHGQRNDFRGTMIMANDADPRCTVYMPAAAPP